MKQINGSFRDRSGYVWSDGQDILRTINASYAQHWNHASDTGFMTKAVADGSIIPFEEIGTAPGSWKTLRVEKIPFVSYPYEWSIGQLKDAALLTLRLQSLALENGLVLKDASAYNMQFRGVSPVFIDLLSFECDHDGKPWSAYRQFCMHFLAPLALASYVDLSCGALSKLWIDGIALDLASKMLPWRTRIRPGLALHLHLHARMEQKHGDSAKSAKKAKDVQILTKSKKNLAENLTDTIRKITTKTKISEWGDYYSDTNYTGEGEKFKLAFVEQIAKKIDSQTLAVDLGANTGRYSRLLAKHFTYVIAADFDPLAVERHYLSLKKNGPKNILPLVLDLANPSPGIGWACRERESFSDRCKADMITALALIHHLTIGAGIPLALSARYFAELLRSGGTLLLEFVEKEDSQIKRLLAVREDVFDDYTPAGMKQAFTPYFDELESERIPGSKRTLHVFQKK